jgi:hypothetical protein
MRGSRRFVFIAFIISFSASIIFGACTHEEDAIVVSSVSTLGYSGTLRVEDAAVLATNSALIGSRGRVDGRVVVLAPSPGTFGQVLADGVRLSVGDFADVGASSGSESFAASAIFRYGADVDRAYIGQVLLDEHDAGFVGANLFPAASMPRPPRARAVSPGSTGLMVVASSTTTISPAGVCTSSVASSCSSEAVPWSSIEVAEAGVLYLRPGSYELEHLTLRDRARVVALGAVELRVAERISVGRGARVVSASARDLRIEALGMNGGARLPASVPRAIDIGDGSVVQAVLFAPNGTLRVGASVALTGAAVARDVWIDDGARVTYQDGLLPLAGGVLAYPDRFVATEDEALHVYSEGVLANDLDPATYAQLFSELVSSTQNGTISLSLDGGFSYTPNANFEGEDAFVYRVFGTAVTATVTIEVDGENDVPVIGSFAPSSAFVGGMWRYAVACADADIGDVLAYSTIGSPATLSIASNVVSWTPSSAGTYEFEVRCTDAAGAFDEQHVRVTVTAIAPLDQLVAYAQSSIIFRGDAFDGSVGALGMTTIDDGASVGGSVFGGSVALKPMTSVGDVYTNSLIEDQSIARGAIAGLPNMPSLPAIAAVTPGTAPLIVSADLTLSSTQSTSLIDVRPDTCLYLRAGIHQTGDVTVGARGCIVALGPVELRIAGRLLVSDHAYIGPDAAMLRIEVSGAAQPFAVETKNQSSLAATLIAPNGSALFGWHSVNWGAFYARDILVADGALFFLGGAAIENEPPSITSTPPASVLEGATFSYAIQVTDTPEDTHTFALELAPSGMSLAGSTLTWTPQNADVGTHTIRVRATDAGGLSDTQTFTLTVINVNNAPAFTSSPATTANEDELYVYAAAAQDLDGDPVSISLLQGPPGMAFTTVLTWTPSQSDIGGHNVVLAATDGELSTTQTFQVIVQEVNDPPRFDGTPPTTAIEDQRYSAVLRASDPDPSDALTFSIVSAPTGMTLNNSTLEWTPTNADVGTHAITLEVRDRTGASAQMSYTLVVANVNDPPELVSTPPTNATENAPLSFHARSTRS